MLVPAFCLTVYRKFKLLLRNDDDTQRRSLIVNFVTFLIFGAFFMSISLFVDIYYFIAHLYTFNNNAISSGFVSAISAEAFNTLEAVVQREVKRLKIQDLREPVNIQAHYLIKTLRTELEITTCI